MAQFPNWPSIGGLAIFGVIALGSLNWWGVRRIISHQMSATEDRLNTKATARREQHKMYIDERIDERLKDVLR